LVLEALHWDLSAVTPFCLLDLLLRRLNNDAPFHLPTVRSHAETFAALVATEHHLSFAAPAGVKAASCLLAAVIGLRGVGAGSEARSEEVNRLLAELAQLTGAQPEALLRHVAAIEEAMRIRMSAAAPADNNNSRSDKEMLPAAQDNPCSVNGNVVVVAASSRAQGGQRGPATAAGGGGGSAPPSVSPTDLVDMSVACVY
jgi:hypothetical protein